MKAVHIDDKWAMPSNTLRICGRIANLQVVGLFREFSEALLNIKGHPVDILFVTETLSSLRGIKLVTDLKEFNPDILVKGESE